MSTQELIDTARTLVAGDKGLLAMDESNPTEGLDGLRGASVNTLKWARVLPSGAQ